MKKIYLLTLLFVGITFSAFAQRNINIGGGYFGHFATHPGFVLEFESEHMYTEKASLPIRVDLGYYSHPRNQKGVFLDANYGFRRYFKSGFFLEESIGLGLLKTSLNTDAAYEVGDDGSVKEVSKGLPADLMPSFTLGMGYKFEGLTGGNNLVWLRPKLSWQLPQKTTSVYHAAIQVGFTHTIGSK